MLFFKSTQEKHVLDDKLQKMSRAKSSSIEAMWCFTFITFLSYSLGSETYSYETFAFIFVDINKSYDDSVKLKRTEMDPFRLG